MRAESHRDMESTLAASETLAAYGRRRHWYPRDLDDYRPAVHALAELSFRHDSLEVASHDPGESWKVTARDMPTCAACEGTGRDPEREHWPCKPCEGHGRRRSVALHVAAEYIVDTEGKVTEQ